MKSAEVNSSTKLFLKNGHIKDSFNRQLQEIATTLFFRTFYSEKYVQDPSIHSNMFFGIYNITTEYVFNIL